MTASDDLVSQLFDGKFLESTSGWSGLVAATKAGGAIGANATDGVSCIARHRLWEDGEERACGRPEEGTRKCGGSDGLSAELEKVALQMG